ncbi:MAG: hypothetical protein HYZ28_28570 [Myxococcales bacterium]|nr:hypothetical protein [Myxococcales bacterium]
MGTSLLLLSAVLAAPPSSAEAAVDEGVRLYDEGDFRAARDVLAHALAEPLLAAPTRGLARMHLAASHYALAELESAEAQLVELFAVSPLAWLDPAKFPPELLSLAEKARAAAAAKAPRSPSQPELAEDAPTSPPLLSEPLRLDASRPVPLSAGLFIPFGVGQFENGHHGKGTLFLALEALCLATAGASLAALESMKREGRFFVSGGFAPGEMGTARTLHAVYLSSFWLGVSLMAGGVVEAVISRPLEGDRAAPLAIRF